MCRAMQADGIAPERLNLRDQTAKTFGERLWWLVAMIAFERVACSLIRRATPASTDTLAIAPGF